MMLHVFTTRSPSCCRFSECYSYSTGLHHLPHLDTLDIPDIDPDITGYCVGVVNSTSSLVIDSQCGITDTQYSYTVSPRSTPCDTYTFTVTPVNIVGNGTSASVTQGILPSGELILLATVCVVS